MGLGEWVLLVGLLGLSGGITTCLTYTKRRRKSISASIQAEIDQTPEWWTNEFRKLQGLPPVPFSDSQVDRWKTAGISEVWVDDNRYSFKHLVDIKPPTISEIWTPTKGGSYDLSVDLSAMMRTIEEAKTHGE